MTPDRLSHEADSAVEELLLKRNGQKKTVNDVFEVVVAMNHDRRSDTALLLEEISKNRGLLESHCANNVHMTEDALARFIEPFTKRHDERDAIVAVLETDLEDVKKNCTHLHDRAPRRKTDPETENWGTGMYSEDQELGDLRRAWRFLKWVVVVLLGTIIVVFGETIATEVFHLK